jgi:Bax protein
MSKGPSAPTHPTRIERFLLGSLAALFVATELAGVLVPAEDLRFIPPRQSVEGRLGALDGLGPPLKVAVARISTTASLRQVLTAARFDLAAIRRGDAEAPAIFLASLPKDLAAIKQVQDKKDLFVGIVLPLILHQNQIVKERRSRLERVLSGVITDHPLPDRKWLLRLARLYRVADPEPDASDLNPSTREELMRRVDTIPVSLALSQAATESGWGTSRFARQGNALYGQWTWQSAEGLVPTDREEGRAHSVRAFATLANSVRTYVHNLNVSNYYSEFRRARARLREAGVPDGSWGHGLAAHLGRYSEEGPDYIAKIRSIMRVNGFGDFETTTLSGAMSPTEAATPGS